MVWKGCVESLELWSLSRRIFFFLYTREPRPKGQVIFQASGGGRLAIFIPILQGWVAVGGGQPGSFWTYQGHKQSLA